MNARVTGLCVAFIATYLAGCVRPQKEEVRSTLIEPTTLGLSDSAAEPAPPMWWQSFGDPQLNRLVDDALAHNPTLDEALARVRESNAEILAAGAAIKPGVTLDADETWQRFSENFYIPPPFAGGRFWVGTVGTNMGWTLDFWGKQAAIIRQARSTDIAARLGTESARLAVAGALAQAYLDLYRAHALTDVAARTLEQRQHLLELTQQRLSAGLDTAIDLHITQARLADARAALEQTHSARELAVHRLAAISGHGADLYAQIERPRVSLENALPIPDSLPINLLARRSDILAARARVDAADAGRAAAKAAFYPDLSLKAFAGFQAIGLGNLFESGSMVYGAGPAFHLPIFDARRLRAAYRRSTAELDLAVASYNDVVLNAVRETADQLSLIDALTKQTQQAHQRFDEAQAAYDLASQRYGAGLVTQLVVLNAETEVLAARQNIVALETSRAISRITLLLTLGGSFNGRI